MTIQRDERDVLRYPLEIALMLIFHIFLNWNHQFVKYSLSILLDSYSYTDVSIAV